MAASLFNLGARLTNFLLHLFLFTLVFPFLPGLLLFFLPLHLVLMRRIQLLQFSVQNNVFPPGFDVLEQLVAGLK